MKHEYSEEFEKFWNSYPRKTAKYPAFKAWQKQDIDGDAFLPRQIIQDIEKRGRLRFWPVDFSKIPHPATWINQRRWDDEGWEDEIKSREPKKGDHRYSRPRYQPIDTGPDMPLWECASNRMLLRYVRTAYGLHPDQLSQALHTKREVLDEMSAALDEEIEADSSKTNEMILLLSETLLHRLDIDCGLALRDRVLTGAMQ